MGVFGLLLGLATLDLAYGSGKQRQAHTECAAAVDNTTVYDFSARELSSEQLVSLDKYRGQVSFSQYMGEVLNYFPGIQVGIFERF